VAILGTISESPMQGSKRCCWAYPGQQLSSSPSTPGQQEPATPHRVANQNPMPFFGTEKTKMKVIQSSRRKKTLYTESFGGVGKSISRSFFIDISCWLLDMEIILGIFWG